MSTVNEGIFSVKVQEQHLFHGAALTQVVEHPSFKALNRASAKYGHYLINTDRYIFVKYRKPSRNGRTDSWTFQLQPSELRTIERAVAEHDKVFVTLVCGATTICALDSQELSALVDLSSKSAQSISVSIPRGGSCHLHGSKGALSRVIAHNAFPEKLFS